MQRACLSGCIPLILSGRLFLRTVTTVVKEILTAMSQPHMQGTHRPEGGPYIAAIIPVAVGHWSYEIPVPLNYDRREPIIA